MKCTNDISQSFNRWYGNPCEPDAIFDFERFHEHYLLCAALHPVTTNFTPSTI